MELPYANAYSLSPRLEADNYTRIAEDSLWASNKGTDQEARKLATTAAQKLKQSDSIAKFDSSTMGGILRGHFGLRKSG